MSSSASPESIDFGRRLWIMRVRELSGRIDVRALIVVTVLIAVALVVAVIALGVGDYRVAPDRVVRTVFGGGTNIERLVVLDWRLPRVLTAFVLGAASGFSGAIFQSLTRNPLGSPDVIGLNVGAYTGALAVILTVGAGFYGTAIGALVGGIATAAVVYVLAYRVGVQGFRLIIVGIAITAMLQSVNIWLISRADLNKAMTAATWGAGSLNAVSWAQAAPAAIAVAVLCIAVVAVSRTMSALDLGDAAAAALGVRTEHARRALILTGVAMSAVVVAIAGPIAFVALSAPQLAKRLTRSPGAGLAGAGAMGALLLVISDFAAQHLFAPTQLPVGVVTVSVGGLYLVWLLAMEARRR